MTRLNRLRANVAACQKTLDAMVGIFGKVGPRHRLRRNLAEAKRLLRAEELRRSKP